MATIPKTKTVNGDRAYLLTNPEVKRIVSNAEKTALEDGFDQVVYQDEPGSVAYCRKSLFGSWPGQTNECIITTIVVLF